MKLDFHKASVARLAGAAALAAVVAASLSNPALADKVRLRFSAPAPPGEILVKAMERFKADLEKRGKGQFDVSVHPGGSLFKQGTEIPAMRRGNLEMNTLATFEVSAYVKELSVYNAGYLFRNYAHLQKVWSGPLGAKYKATVLKKMGIRILANCYLGTREVNISKVRHAKTPADLKGIKLRMPGAPDFLLLGRGLGIIPTPMAMSEAYLAIKNGAVDGQDNPVTITRAAKMDEVTKEVVLTNHMVQMVFFAIAEKAFQKMTKAQQSLVVDASKKACAWNDKMRLADEKKQIAYFKSRGIVITHPDIAAFRKHMWETYARAGKLKTWPKAVIDAIRATK
jgi:tripartite ATP-independent transporter DctP family solute receptor